jgi:protein gp37
LNSTKISWTEKVWNPLTGCTKISSGCRHCYAEIIANDLQAQGNKRYANGFNLTLQRDKVDEPRHWRKPRLVFVNSMSDIFHKDVPFDYIASIFGTMNACPQHTFQVLTKRSDILLQYAPRLKWSDNIWMGVTVEDQSQIHRIDDLRQVPAKVRFLSLEPLLGPIPNLNLNGIHWVIVGGESGSGTNRFRPMDVDWARDIRDQCVTAGVKFFFKQYSGPDPKLLPHDLDGVIWHEMP